MKKCCTCKENKEPGDFYKRKDGTQEKFKPSGTAQSC